MKLAAIITLALFAGCLAASAATVRLREPVRDACHKLELNHVYSTDDGKDRLVQLIGRDPGNVVLWWRMAKPNMTPRRDWQRGGWVSTWTDGETLREIRAPHADETWTIDDEEVLQRGMIPECQRRGLLPAGGVK